jgi:hypothetical protein
MKRVNTSTAALRGVVVWTGAPPLDSGEHQWYTVPWVAPTTADHHKDGCLACPISGAAVGFYIGSGLYIYRTSVRRCSATIVDPKTRILFLFFVSFLFCFRDVECWLLLSHTLLLWRDRRKTCILGNLSLIEFQVVECTMNIARVKREEVFRHRDCLIEGSICSCLLPYLFNLEEMKTLDE